MTRDARLDAFASTGGDTEDTDGEAAAEGAAGEGETEGSDELPGGEEPPSLAITSESTPAGAECPTCGGVVERRWRQNGALVCSQCKEWEGV